MPSRTLRAPWFALVVVLAACETGSPAAPARTSSTPTGSTAASALPLWDPVDVAFAGCQGACGAHVEGTDPDVVSQPGAAIGQRTYCPVSGAVFEVATEHPHVDVDGRTLYFCCPACAEYFQAHRDHVLEARGMTRAEHASRGRGRPGK